MSPHRTPSICSTPGCGGVASSGRGKCAHCAGAAGAKDREERGSAHERGYDRTHAKWRTLILSRDPLCVRCLGRSEVTPSTIADHIVPVRNGGESTLENGQGLCVPCHNVKMGHEKRGEYPDWRQP